MSCGTRLRPSRSRARRQPAQFDERGIDVEQLGGLRAALAGLDARSGEDQRHAGAAVPERVLAGDAFFAQVPAVVAPDDDDRVVGQAGFVERVEHAADLRVHEARAGQVGADEVAPLVVFPDPLQPRFGQFPVQIPGEPRRVGAVVLPDRPAARCRRPG